MRPFIISTMLFALLQTVLIALTLVVFGDMDRVSPFMPAIAVKHERLERAASPRMILVGGSNLLFGIDSALLEQRTGFHVVNMGLMRGLPLDYLLNEIDRQLRPGDLVVLCLEYGTLNGDSAGNEAQVIMEAMSSRTESIAYLNWAQIRQLLDAGAIEYLGMSLRRAVRNALSGSDDGERAARKAEIMKHVNHYGDLTLYHDPAVQIDATREQATLERVDMGGVRASVARINAFSDTCRPRGVHVVFTWPPISKTHLERHRAYAQRFNDLVRRTIEVPVVSSPEDMAFEDEHFIGLSYHLHGRGVQLRTLRLIHALAGWLKNSEARP